MVILLFECSYKLFRQLDLTYYSCTSLIDILSYQQQQYNAAREVSKRSIAPEHYNLCDRHNKMCVVDSMALLCCCFKISLVVLMCCASRCCESCGKLIQNSEYRADSMTPAITSHSSLYWRQTFSYQRSLFYTAFKSTTTIRTQD